jgi:tetratricopeptide (TPR) repeat protein
LRGRVIQGWSDDPAGDTARAEKTIDAALTLQPDSSSLHDQKGWLFFVKRQWGSMIAEAETAIADNPNNADAHAEFGFSKLFLGHAEDGFADVETALRLSPRDPQVPWWQLYMCTFHAKLGHWEQAIPWCNKAVAGLPEIFYPLVELAAANAWAGHDKEAKDAAAQLQKVYPGFTVQTWAGIHWTDNPTYNAQNQRIIEGLRKAGMPEGDKKTNCSRPRRPSESNRTSLERGRRRHRVPRQRHVSARVLASPTKPMNPTLCLERSDMDIASHPLPRFAASRSINR